METIFVYIVALTLWGCIGWICASIYMELRLAYVSWRAHKELQRLENEMYLNQVYKPWIGKDLRK